MSDLSLYVADKLMKQWPYLPNPERVKIASPSHESMDNFFLLLDAKSARPVLSWESSTDRVRGFRHTQ